ncbi:MAG: hypothetical protein ACKVX7_09495 [Planctomycetota bacterium]
MRAETSMRTDLPNCDRTASGRALTGAERSAVRLLFSTYRWLGTVVLECGLGLFFLCAPRLTLEILEVPDSIYTAAVFQLYGVLLLHRGLVQQILCRRRDVELFRKFLFASLPFSAGSTIVLGYCVLEGMMGALVGWAVVATFVIEIIDNSLILYFTRAIAPTQFANR